MCLDRSAQAPGEPYAEQPSLHVVQPAMTWIERDLHRTSQTPAFSSAAGGFKKFGPQSSPERDVDRSFEDHFWPADVLQCWPQRGTQPSGHASERVRAQLACVCLPDCRQQSTSTAC